MNRSDGHAATVGVSEPDRATTHRGPVALHRGAGEAGADENGGAVVHPTKVVRIAAMLEGLLEESHQQRLGWSARRRLATVHEQALASLHELVSDDLDDELDSLGLPLARRGVPSTSELRLAFAQLIGWLEGLLSSMQVTIVSRRLSDAQEAAELRREALESVRQEQESARRRQYL